MNWGHKLTIAIVVFICVMGFMVYQAMQTDFQLVEKGYYKSELKYQQVIDGNQRANALSGRVHIVKSGDRVIVQLPEEMKNREVQGSLWFYCAYDEKMDRRFALRPDKDAIQELDAGLFGAGNYTVKVEWTSNDQHYYSEQKLAL
ncbi:MAG TPA: FixH family protein [Agriterribacter sp.]|nr:FixH family protein [Agriterribacter sp.]HRQ51963.1 FixH family protein [Agriterribacter sp.]